MQGQWDFEVAMDAQAAQEESEVARPLVQTHSPSSEWVARAELEESEVPRPPDQTHSLKSAAVGIC